MVIKNFKYVCLLVALLLALTIFFSAAGKELTVCHLGCEYNLKEAIAQAQDGDTILVNAGSYEGGISIDKSITLRGAGKEKVTVNGSLSIGPAKVKVTITGITLTDSTKHGISLSGDAEAVVKSTTVTGSLAHSIYLTESAEITITNSSLKEGGKSGLFAKDESEVKINRSNISNNAQNGAEISGKSILVIENSEINSNGRYGLSIQSNATGSKTNIKFENVNFSRNGLGPAKSSTVLKKLDSVPPNLQLQKPQNDTIEERQVTFEWSGGDNVTDKGKLEYSYYLESYDEDWSSWVHKTSREYTDLTLGSFRFHIKARDQAGNTTNVKNKSISVVDNIPPTVQFLQHPEGFTEGNNVTFELKGEDNLTPDEDISFSYFLEGYENEWSDFAKKNKKVYEDLKEGSYVFKVKAEDEAGNVNILKRSFTIIPPFSIEKLKEQLPEPSQVSVTDEGILGRAWSILRNTIRDESTEFYFLRKLSVKGFSPLLISLIKNPDESLEVRKNAIILLLEADSLLSIPALIEVIQNDQFGQKVKLLAIEALGKFNDKRVSPFLLDLLSKDLPEGDRREEHKQLQKATIKALVGLDETRAEEVLIRKTKDSYLRLQTIKALGQLGSRRAINPLLDTIEGKKPSDNKKLFRAVIHSITDIGIRVGMNKNKLLETVKNTYEEIEPLRSTVIEVLGRIGSSSSTPLLIRMFRGENSDYNIKIAKALSRTGGERAIDTIITMYNQATGGATKGELIKSLGSTNSQEALDFLVNLAQDPKARNELVIDTIGNMSLLGVKHELRNLLESVEGDLADQILKTLGKLGDDSFLDQDLLSAAENKPHRFVNRVIPYLRELGTKEARQILLKSIDKAPHDCWEKDALNWAKKDALKALAEFDFEEPNPILLQYLYSPNDWVRAASVNFFGEIGEGTAISLLKQAIYEYRVGGGGQFYTEPDTEVPIEAVLVLERLLAKSQNLPSDNLSITSALIYSMEYLSFKRYKSMSQEDLIHDWDDQDYYPFSSVVNVLTKVAGQSSCNFLGTMANVSNNWQARLAATISLAKLAGNCNKEAIPYLVEGLSDKKRLVSIASSVGLVKLANESSQVIEEDLESKQEETYKVFDSEFSPDQAIKKLNSVLQKQAENPVKFPLIKYNGMRAINVLINDYKTTLAAKIAAKLEDPVAVPIALNTLYDTMDKEGLSILGYTRSQSAILSLFLRLKKPGSYSAREVNELIYSSLVRIGEESIPALRKALKLGYKRAGLAIEMIEKKN